MKAKFQIAFGVAWIILGVLNGGRTLADGIKFLFRVDKSYIGNPDQIVTQDELWRMHNGFWALAMLAFGICVLIPALWKIFRGRDSGSTVDETTSSEQAEDVQPAAAAQLKV